MRSVRANIDSANYELETHRPHDFSFLTRGLWRAGEETYVNSARTEAQIAQYINLRETLGESRLASLASSIELRLAKRFKKGVFLSDHSLWCVDGATLMQFDVWADASYANSGADEVVVPTPEAAELLKSYGLDGSRAVITGFPVHPDIKRAEDRDKLIQALRSGYAELAFMATGAGSPLHYDYVDETLIPGISPLLKAGRSRLTIFTGRDEEKALGYRTFLHGEGYRICLNQEGEDAQVSIRFGHSYEEAQSQIVSICQKTHFIIGMIGEKTGMAGLRLLVPLFATSPNAHYDQAWLAKNGYAPSVRFAEVFPEVLTEQLKIGGPRFIEQLERAYDGVPREGAENTAGIVEMKAKRRSGVVRL